MPMSGGTFTIEVFGLEQVKAMVAAAELMAEALASTQGLDAFVVPAMWGTVRPRRFTSFQILTRYRKLVAAQTQEALAAWKAL